MQDAASQERRSLPPLVVSGELRAIDERIRSLGKLALSEDPRYVFDPQSDFADQAFCWALYRLIANYHLLARFRLSERPSESIVARALSLSGREVSLPDSDTSSYDLLLCWSGERVSLKSEGGKRIGERTIRLSKFKELRSSRRPTTAREAASVCREELVEQFSRFDRLLILRAFDVRDEQARACVRYDLLEAPKGLFAGLATTRPADVSIGGQTMKVPLRQPEDGQTAAWVVFDGSASKASIRGLRADLCRRHCRLLVPYGREVERTSSAAG